MYYVTLVEYSSRRTIQNKKRLKKSAGLIKDIESLLSEKQEKTYESVKKTNKSQPIKMNKYNEFGLGIFVFPGPCYKQ